MSTWIGLEQSKLPTERNGVEYSIADQEARVAHAKETQDVRFTDITAVYDGSGLNGLRVLITGGEVGLGFEIVKEIVANGGHAICAGKNSSKLLNKFAEENSASVTVITDVDTTKEETMETMCNALKDGGPLDILINGAGYVYGPKYYAGIMESVGIETYGYLNHPNELLQIDICAVGPLRVTSALYKAGLLVGEKSKVIIITAQGGSCEWRFTQNPVPTPKEDFPGNYGHHMSKAACNMMGVILSQEMAAASIPVQMLHAGFNATTKTPKHTHIWEKEGAVEPEIGAKRVLYETLKADMSTSGSVINCEDGKRIPW